MPFKRSHPSILQRKVISAKKPRLEDTPFSAVSICHYCNHNQKAGDGRHINQTKPSYDVLPHLPLISLLEKLPLVDLLPLRAVCQRWNHFATNIVVKKRTRLCLASYYSNEYENATRNIRIRIDLARFLDVDLTKFDFIIGICETIYLEWLEDSVTTEVTKVK